MRFHWVTLVGLALLVVLTATLGGVLVSNTNNLMDGRQRVLDSL